jgi:hypothetical protein
MLPVCGVLPTGGGIAISCGEQFKRTMVSTPLVSTHTQLLLQELTLLVLASSGEGPRAAALLADRS